MLETEILLSQLGITTNYKGHAILVAAVDIVHANPDALDDIMVSVYAVVADKLGISVSCVERNICTAVSRAWAVASYRFGRVLGYREPAPPRSSALIRLLHSNVKNDTE